MDSETLTVDTPIEGELLKVLKAYKKGDYTIRMKEDIPGYGLIAETLN